MPGHRTSAGGTASRPAIRPGGICPGSNVPGRPAIGRDQARQSGVAPDRIGPMESAATPSGPVPETGPEPLRRRARFLREADQLKGVLRQSSILDGSRKENSAEHSWHLALMALVLGDYAPPGTDLNRVTAMLLIHDLVEIDAGDLFVYADAAAQARQEAAEHAAADRIFALLPAGQGRGLRALWEEFGE